MAKPENNENFPEKQTWGTWEELLLACAVHRYGTDSWDSVAGELQKRTSSLRSLTPVACRHRYLDLKRRFSRKPAAADGDTAAEISAVPWLDELRKLRVAELRREVELYDLSISSLQLKVKRLEEERERSTKEAETRTEIPDLDKIAEKKESHRDSDDNSGEPVAGPPNQSVNESNSPDPKDDSTGTGPEDANREGKGTEPVIGEPDGAGGDAKPAGEDSCRGSCESGAKESGGNSGRVDPGESPELIESVAESKGGENRGDEEAKETSDVQSSASLPRKDEPDNEDQSPTVKGIPVESQPLADFLEILQSQTFGSHFSRRLQSQETPEYGKIIRQHIDFEIIRSRLEEGLYAVSTRKFFRDLLLLVSNVKVFYGKGTSEFKSAEQLYELVKKQIALKVLKQTSPLKEESSMVPKAVPESLHPLSLKPRMSVPMIACRKRSSLAARSPVSASGPVQKRMKMTPVVDEKPASISDVEDEAETSDKDDVPLISKKRATRERTSSNATRVANKNLKNRSNPDTGLNVRLPSKGRSSNDGSQPKKTDEEKKGNTNASSKKQSVASFLKRMKGGSSSETMLETVKTSSGADSSIGKRGAEQRKNNSSKDKVDAGKAQSGQKRATGKKQTNEKGSPAKKSTGRAPKRGAAPSSPLLGKRGKEAAEKEAGTSTRAKKRSRR